LAGLITLAFGRSGFDFQATFAVADLDGGQLAEVFVGETLAGADLGDSVTLKMVGDRDEAVRLARTGEAAAAIIVPAGYSSAALASQPIPRRSSTPPTSASVPTSPSPSPRASRPR
jgi:hypothetical protein